MIDEQFLGSMCAAGQAAARGRSDEGLAHLERDEVSFGTMTSLALRNLPATRTNVIRYCASAERVFFPSL